MKIENYLFLTCKRKGVPVCNSISNERWRIMRIQIKITIFIASWRKKQYSTLLAGFFSIESSKTYFIQVGGKYLASTMELSETDDSKFKYKDMMKFFLQLSGLFSSEEIW